MALLLCVGLRSTGMGAADWRNWAADERGAQIEAAADELNYDRDTGRVDAKGNVLIRRGGTELRANYVHGNLKSGHLQSSGAYRDH